MTQPLLGIVPPGAGFALLMLFGAVVQPVGAALIAAKRKTLGASIMLIGAVLAFIGGVIAVIDA